MALRRILVFVALAAVCSAVTWAQDINDDLENATKEALKKVGPSVVQIVTQGGTDMVVTTAKGPAFRKAMGPTTGVIVSTDGYVISSAFNFINNPTNILVAVPGIEQPFVAKKIATDKSRLLTLLKIDADKLPVAPIVPKKEITEGQWTIALGRTLDTKRAHPPSVSVGIVSALGRVWGKCIQTDAKISPTNYGGPIVDIQGRIQGILIPASPQGTGETAGFEWYDSGIGFAIPMEDVMAVLPRLMKGVDLKEGVLGVRMKSADMYSVAPEIADVTKGSAAEKAGLKPGDVIIEVDGKPVVRMAQVKHILGPKYEGDKVSIKYKRGDQIVAIELDLVGSLTAAGTPFLGILPMRDDPKLGVEVRHVFPKSPAEKAGLKPGDRIVKYGSGEKADVAFTGEVAGRQQFTNWLNTQPPGTEVALEVVKKDGGKSDTVKAKLEPMPGAAGGGEFAIPDKLPEGSHKKALTPLETANPKVKPPKVDPDDKKVETGLIKRNTPDGEHKFWVFVPENYDPNIAHSLVVWLHPPGKNKEADVEAMTGAWEDLCGDQHIIMIGPNSDNENGWIPSEADGVVAAIRDTLPRYTIDRQRVVAHGMGVGGQLAMYLGFTNRDLVRGVATVGAVATQVKDISPNQRLAFYLAGGSLDPLIKSIGESKTKLADKKYSVFFREVPDRGREYLEEAQVREVARWIDALDKQ